MDKESIQRVLFKYPDRVPIFVDKEKNVNLPELEKKKFLVPNNFTFGEFIFLVRKRIMLNSSHALFFFTENGCLINTSDLMSDVYKKYKDENGICKFKYAPENTFGNLFI